MCHSSHHIAWVHVNTREIEHETVKHSQKQGVRNEGMGSEMMQRHANSDLICINR